MADHGDSLDLWLLAQVHAGREACAAAVKDTLADPTVRRLRTLIELLTDADEPHAIDLAVGLIGNYGVFDGLPVGLRLVGVRQADRLVAASGSANPRVSWAAAQLLARLLPDRLAPQATDPDPAVRLRAVQAAGTVNTPETLAILRHAGADQDAAVRSAALRALVVDNHDETDAVFEAVIHRDDLMAKKLAYRRFQWRAATADALLTARDDAVRVTSEHDLAEAAALVLVNNVPRSRPYLINLLSAALAEVRVIAAQALAPAAGADEVHALIGLASSGDTRAATEALFALATSAEPAAIDAISEQFPFLPTDVHDTLSRAVGAQGTALAHRLLDDFARQTLSVRQSLVGILAASKVPDLRARLRDAVLADPSGMVRARAIELNKPLHVKVGGLGGVPYLGGGSASDATAPVEDGFEDEVFDAGHVYVARESWVDEYYSVGQAGAVGPSARVRLPPTAAIPIPPSDQFFNTWISQLGDPNAVVPQLVPLEPAHPYQLCIVVGAIDHRSVVRNAMDNPVPPVFTDPAALEILVVSDDVEVSSGLFRSGLHDVVTVPFMTKAGSGLVRIRIILLYEGNCLLSAVVTARVGPGLAGGNIAVIDYLLTSQLDQVATFQPSTLAIHSALGPGGEFRVVVHGGEQDMFTAALRDGPVREAALISRNALIDIHFGPAGTRSRYDRENRLPPAACRADLATLAQQGWRLFQQILRTAADRKTFRQLLIDTAQATGSPASIQLTQTDAGVVSFPWQLIYDIPCTGNPPEFQDCPSLARALEGSIDPVTASCPYEHKRNTLCPYGLWGFAQLLASPPSSTRAPRALVIGDGASPFRTVAAISDELDPAMTRAHVNDLRADTNVRDCTDLASLEAELKRGDADIVYFYCHGKRRETPGGRQPIPVLEIGKSDQLTPEELVAWSFDWRDPYWQPTQPLVIMNGCHTSELTPDLLVDFVTTFQELRAAGSIGTEIALTQPVATEAAQLILESLWHGATVAESIRDMRWKLLAKGNLMGLAYTPYCYGAVRLRPAAAA
jgi:HEAT repeat protein